MLPRISTRSAFADALQGWPPPVLDPAGPFAGPVTILAWVLLAMSALVLLAVIAALWIAFHGKGRLKDQIGSKQIIWIGGQIGRESCRGRVCQYVSISVGAVPLKKQNNAIH